MNAIRSVSVPPPPYTAEDVARMLGLDPKTVRTAITCGSLPGYRVGRNFIIPREAFERFMQGDWRPTQPTDFIQRRRSA